MGSRVVRLELRLSVEEREVVVEAASCRGMPVARYARECVVASARGRVVPSSWLADALDGLEEVQARLRGVRGFMPDGWEDELSGLVDDIIHVGSTALDGDEGDV